MSEAERRQGRERVERRPTRQISVGGVTVGGGAPVRVQSMTCAPSGEAEGTLAQVRALAAAGCELVRVSLPEAEGVAAFGRVVRESPVPIIADIHFDWRLALAAIEQEAAGVRINPGTIAEKRVREIVRAAAERGQGGDRAAGQREGDGVSAGARVADDTPVAIRIGVNQGSLPRRLRGRAERDPAGALVAAALDYAGRIEDWGFTNFKLSVKSSSVLTTIDAYRRLSAVTDAPLHVGVTEAGTAWSGTIKSAAGIGTLLAEGIGDTLRVSLTADPVEEVRVAWKLLGALELRRRGADVISCPTCARTELDIVALAEEVERRLELDPSLAGRALTVAVMGCRVNGPEEARHADFGIAGGAGEGVVFAHGRKVATAPESDLVDTLLGQIKAERGAGGGPASA
jgi:(E)-4-hydroxy-3-methylbut-2-enyl-diphosphate synthase